MLLYWSLQVGDDDYTDIADGSDTNFDVFPIILIVVGVVILGLGLMGCLGAMCGNKGIGRCLLGFVRCDAYMYIHTYIKSVCHCVCKKHAILITDRVY